MSDIDSVTQSFTEEILNQEMQLKRQTSLERTVNVNTLRINAILCIVLLSIVTYFIIGQNYILNWTPNNPDDPNRVFELGIKSFRADGFATFYVCLDFNDNCKVSERDLCRNNDFAFASDFKNECEELRRFYPVGIIFIACLVCGSIVNITTLISVCFLLKEKETLPEIGVGLSKFEFVFYLIASIEYLFHCLFLKGSFSYCYPIVIIYSAIIISVANIISFRLAFHSYIRIRTLKNLIHSH